MQTALAVLSLFFCALNSNAQNGNFKIPNDRKINIGVLVYDGVEIVDTGGPIDVFVKANNITGKYKIYTVSATEKKKIIMDGGTVNLVSQFTIFDAPQSDILIIPGTSPEIVRTISKDKNMMDWIVKQNEKTQITMSVCTGGLILANTGLLDGRAATTHHWSLDELRSHPKIKVKQEARFVADGKFLTGAGVTSGIDTALEAVELIHGKDFADEIAQGMVYDRYNDMDFLLKK
ncbi:DJ-1/PfpI family protein [Flavobacterium chungangensis]|uniref:DJ-1/PfpI family protein n=1 Tax=Flavobacterium chungangensis TaxID=2708132 RepID=A0ABV8ZI20_9FLAO